MRISDWSSDVCSSDLLAVDAEYPGELAAAGKIGARGEPSALDIPEQRLDDLHIDRHIARGVDPLAETTLPRPPQSTPPDKSLTSFPVQTYRRPFRIAARTGLQHSVVKRA